MRLVDLDAVLGVVDAKRILFRELQAQAAQWKQFGEDFATLISALPTVETRDG